jgi:hypothetical protein
MESKNNFVRTEHNCEYYGTDLEYLLKSFKTWSEKMNSFVYHSSQQEIDFHILFVYSFLGN